MKTTKVNFENLPLIAQQVLSGHESKDYFKYTAKPYLPEGITPGDHRK